MLNKSDYDRLMPEYISAYNRNCRPIRDVSKILKWAALFEAVFVLLVILLYVYTKDDSGIFLLVSTPIIVIVTVAVGIHERNRWNKTAELIKTSVASYECTVTDCGGYTFRGGKSSNTNIIFKFVYNKGGAVVTDMVRLWFGDVYKGDLHGARITLHETRGGEKVVSVFIPKMGEYRLIY